MTNKKVLAIITLIFIVSSITTGSFASAKKDDNDAVRFVSSFGSFGSDNGQFAVPQGIALDKSGNIYVTDISNSRVDVFDSKGNFVFKFGTFGSGPGKFVDPQGITVDESGNIYVVDESNGTVEIFNSARNLLS